MPPNVIRDLRESLGLTQKDLAELASITPQRVLRDEQFIYITPADSVVRALSERLEDTSEQSIIDRYVKARSKMHRLFTDDLTTSPFYQDRVNDAVNYAIDHYDDKPGDLQSPTKMFRWILFEHYGLPSSAIKFSQFTGMHPGTLSDIETGKIDWSAADLFIHVLKSNLAVSDKHIAMLGRLHDNYFIRKV